MIDKVAVAEFRVDGCPRLRSVFASLTSSVNDALVLLFDGMP